jgi:hypothetical protein
MQLTGAPRLITSEHRPVSSAKQIMPIHTKQTQNQMPSIVIIGILVID